MFCIFIDDISLELTVCKILLYADGAKLYFVIRNPSDSIKLQQEIDKFMSWAFAIGLNVNNSKCNHISFARGPLTLQSSYRLDNTYLGRVDSIRDLGVIMDSKMSFDAQVSAVVKKSLKILGLLKKGLKCFQEALDIGSPVQNAPITNFNILLIRMVTFYSNCS